MSQTSLSIASASSPGDLNVTYFTETPRHIATSPARSAATPPGSPVEFTFVTNRKFDRLMPARRTPVGASSEMTSGDKGMLIETVTLVGDSYPTTLSKDSLSRICPRNNRPDSRAPLQSLVGRPSPILRSPRTVGKGARLASDFTAKTRLGNVSLRAEKGGIICKKAAIMGATTR